jgi:Ni/Fe-hydrogenase 1 B-type cytochrome subunit
MQGSAVSSAQVGQHRESIYVFELPVRIWHWVHALSIAVLAVTGYLIANPLPSPEGEASANFLMGNMRLVHFIAAYVFAIGFAVRIYWSIVGNKYSRELIYVPVWSGKWWGELIEEVKFYLFLRREAPLTEAHNALAQIAMWLFNTVLGIFMIGTGFALYSENLGLGSWADRWFGWIVPVMGGSQNLKMWHTMGMWLFIVFAIVHIYMAFRAEFMGRQSSIRTIVDGWRRYRD